MDDTERRVVAARNKARASAVKAAYFAGLRGATLRDSATDEERRAHGAGKERRALGRERLGR